MVIDKETIELNKNEKKLNNQNSNVKFKHKCVENMFNNLDKFNKSCDDFMIKYIKPFFYRRAYTLWWIYLFIFSLIFPFFKGACFCIGSVMCFGWYACVYFDYYLYDKPYDILYRSMPTYNKKLLNICDIIVHIGLYILCYFSLTEKIKLADVFIAWIYSKIWSYVQSDGKSFYYSAQECKIYNCKTSKIFICSHSIENIVLLIHALITQIY